MTSWGNQVYIPPPDYDNSINVVVTTKPFLRPYPVDQFPDQSFYIHGEPAHSISKAKSNELPNSISNSGYYSVRGAQQPNTDAVSPEDVDISNGSNIYDYPRDVLPSRKVRSHRPVMAVIVAVLCLVIIAAVGAPTLYATVFNPKAGAHEGNPPVDGIWNDWQAWSDCSATCGNGVMTRNRTCDNPAPLFGGNNCDGPASEIQSCMLINCSVNGNWSVWLPWSSCSTSCDNGSRTRSRTCDNPVPAFGGEDCDGIETESEACMITNCSINGNWSSWQAWRDCSTSCGNGVMARNRTCDNPAPSFGGNNCDGSASEIQSCMLINCSVNGNWSVWLPWSSCSTSCDNGSRTRSRTCDNPLPAFGGEECDGLDTESEACMEIHCPIHGNWSLWQPWSECSTTCGGGIKNRTRVCDNPVPNHNGLDCDRHDFELSTCNDVTCPPPGVWGPWAEWTDCSASCGEGVSSRTRDCDNSAGGECIGTNSETKTCQLLKCYDSWGDWSACSLTCGTGIRTRNRTCDGQYIKQECGWHTPTFRDSKTCQNSAICETSFCGSRSANCSYNHPNRCDMYITCDAGKIMYERMCNVLMRYKVRTDDACKGFCDWEANVPCSL